MSFEEEEEDEFFDPEFDKLLKLRQEKQDFDNTVFFLRSIFFAQYFLLILRKRMKTNENMAKLKMRKV